MQKALILESAAVCLVTLPDSLQREANDMIPDLCAEARMDLSGVLTYTSILHPALVIYYMVLGDTLVIAEIEQVVGGR